MARLGDYVRIRTGKLDANASSENGQYPFFTCAIEPLKIDSYSYDCECVLVAGNGDLNVKYYKIIDKVTEYGDAAASAAVGAGVGLLVVGPAGAVVGSLAGTIIENVVKMIREEIKERKLSKSESKKVCSVYSLASEIIAQKLSAGKTLRSDDFFAESEDDRSTAEEILEGTLFAAQHEAE